MQTSKWLSTVAGAAIFVCSSVAANATEVAAYYSLNGGAITLAPDFAPSPTALLSVFAAGGFTVNLATAASVPTSLPNLFNTNLQSLHTGSVVDNIKVYILSLDNAFPTGNQTLTSTFTQNGAELIAGTLSTYAGASALTSPFPDPTSLASLDLATLLGTTTFPPNLANVAINGNAVLAPGFSLAAVYDITATGQATSNATVNIAQVPGPIVGAGLPGLIAACGGLLALARRRRKEQV